MRECVARLPVRSPVLGRDILQMRAAVEVERRTDDRSSQQDVRNVLLGDDSANQESVD